MIANTINKTIMTTTELKQQILDKSFGGIMYDITEGSDITKLVLANDDIAKLLVDEIKSSHVSNGVEEGIASFITELMGS